MEETQLEKQTNTEGCKENLQMERTCLCTHGSASSFIEGIECGQENIQHSKKLKL